MKRGALDQRTMHASLSSMHRTTKELNLILNCRVAALLIVCHNSYCDRFTFLLSTTRSHHFQSFNVAACIAVCPIHHFKPARKTVYHPQPSKSPKISTHHYIEQKKITKNNILWKRKLFNVSYPPKKSFNTQSWLNGNRGREKGFGPFCVKLAEKIVALQLKRKEGDKKKREAG